MTRLTFRKHNVQQHFWTFWFLLCITFTMYFSQCTFSCEKFYFNKIYFFTLVRYVPALRPLRQQAFLLAFPQTLPSRLAQRLAEVTCTCTHMSTIWFCKCLNVEPCKLLFLITDHKGAGYESGYWHSDGFVWENWQWHPSLHQHITGERDVCFKTCKMWVCLCL